MTSLRSRRRRATEYEIAAAALALFKSKGVQATSVDEIVRAADVSERTFFRYFARKEDCVLVAHAELHDELKQSIETLDLSERPFEHVRAAYVRVVAGIDGDDSQTSSLLLRVDEVMRSDAQLQHAGLRLDAEHGAWLTGVLTNLPGTHPLEARLFAEELGILFRQTMRWWTERRLAYPSSSLLECMGEVDRTWTNLHEPLRDNGCGATL